MPPPERHLLDLPPAPEAPPPPPSFRSHALLGMAGSVLLFLGSLGVGWLPASSQLLDAAIVTWLRATTTGAGLSRIAVFLGVAVLLQAWLRLGIAVLDGHEADVTRLARILAIWIAPLILMPPLFSRDAYSYYAQGQLLLAGISPYQQGVSALPGWFQSGADPLWAEAPTPYGPAFLLIEQGVAAVAGRNAYAGAILFRLVALTGVMLLVRQVPQLAHRHGIHAPSALWLAVLNPLVLMHFVAGAHNDALMVGLIVAGLAGCLDRSPVRGIVLIGLAGAVKPIALIVLPFAGLVWAGVRAGWWQRIAAWARSGLLVLIVFVALSVVARVGLGWVASLSTPGSVRTWLSPSTAIGMILGWVLERISLGSTDTAVGLIRALAMLVGAVIYLYLVLAPHGRSAVRGAALALLAVVALGPVVQPWYLLWALPLLAATGLRAGALRLALLVTLVLIVHGMAESNATADTVVDVRDGIAAVLAATVVAVVLLRPPQHGLTLLLGPTNRSLMPADGPARQRAASLVVQAPGRPSQKSAASR